MKPSDAVRSWRWLRLGFRCDASSQRCRVSLIVLLPREPMHDDDTIISFQADRRAGLGDHQSIMADGRVPSRFSLVALFVVSALTTISATTDIINILSAAVQRRISSSEHARDQAISAQTKLSVVRGLTSYGQTKSWHVHVPSPPYCAAQCGPSGSSTSGTS